MAINVHSNTLNLKTIVKLVRINSILIFNLVEVVGIMFLEAIGSC